MRDQDRHALTNGRPLMAHGATALSDGRVRFRVWAPGTNEVMLALEGREPLAMETLDRGWYETTARASHGSRYLYVVDGNEMADPASRWQPDGVDAASAVADLTPPAPWTPPPLRDWVMYELHVGTFTTEGTLDAAAKHLPDLAELGVTAIELMPLGAFPGKRNWGYDGVFPFAVQESYGGPEAFVRFVDAAHAAGVAVVVDVVYNHSGPEGSVLQRFGHYFTGRYTTPWGDAINFDGPGSDAVRSFVRENALMWTHDYGADGLRVDAAHELHDESVTHILAELAADARAAGKIVIAESAANDPRVTDPDGLAVHAQWSDDLHHALHAVLTGERESYYADFGTPEHVAQAMRSGFVRAGTYSAARGHTFGAPLRHTQPEQLVVCIQNHDQIGNRPQADRLGVGYGWDKARLAAAAILLSPFTPLLFMGEEYGETAPFEYFVDHRDPELLASVRAGRARETGDASRDPASVETFVRSTLMRHEQPGMRELYRDLLRIRRTHPPLQRRTFADLDVRTEGNVVYVRRGGSVLALNFGGEPVAAPRQRLIDTADPRYGASESELGMLAGWSAALWDD